MAATAAKKIPKKVQRVSPSRRGEGRDDYDADHPQKSCVSFFKLGGDQIGNGGFGR
jgi:hypothetical protein